MLALQQGNAERVQQDNSSRPSQNGFMQAFAQASGKPSATLTATINSAATQAGSFDTVERRLQTLGLSEEQLQSADMQALIADIVEQPALQEALETLATSLTTQAEGGFANISGAPLLSQANAQLEAAAASFTENAQGSLQEITQRLALVAMFGTPPADTSVNPLAKTLSGESGPLSERVMALLSGVAAAQQGDGKRGNGGLGQHLAALSALRNNGAEAANLSQSTPVSDNSAPQPRISSEALVSALMTTPQGRSLNSDFSPALTQGLSAQGLSAAGQQSTGGMLSQAPQASIQAPLTSAAWPRELGQQLVQFAQRGGEQQIKLNIHPAELGPLTVSLKMGEQGAQAHFLSAHAQVRQVLETAIPQLREALAEQGINLADTSVGEQRQQENGDAALAGGGGNQSGDHAASGDSEALDDASSPRQTVTLDGRVDLYA